MQGLSVSVEQGQIIIRMNESHAEGLVEILRMADYFANEVGPIVEVETKDGKTIRSEINNLSADAKQTIALLLDQVSDAQMKLLMEEI